MSEPGTIKTVVEPAPTRGGEGVERRHQVGRALNSHAGARPHS